MSLSAKKAAVGDTVTLTWSSSNATSCTGSGYWTGAQATSGSIPIKPAGGGQYSFALQCAGDGGLTSQSVALVVPLGVYPTSYENAKSITLSDPNLPSPEMLGLAPPRQTFFQPGFAFADFFQEGSYSAVVQMVRTDDPGQVGLTGPEWPNEIHFLRKDSSGKWVDATSALLADTTGCITPRKALVADFNEDGKPDVFFACSGYDGAFPIPPNKPHPGEQQVLLLSQPDGTYKNVKLLFVAYGHGATAADINHDGHVDVVVTNPLSYRVDTQNGWYNPDVVTDAMPFVLLGDGTGNFRLDTAAIPPELHYRGIFNLEVIPMNGRTMLLLGDSAGNAMYELDSTGAVDVSTKYALPILSKPGFALDFVYEGNFLYLSQIPMDYTEQVIQRLDFTDQSVSTVYDNSAELTDGGQGFTTTWVPWIYRMSSGTFRGQTVGCPKAPAANSVCSVFFSP